MQRRMTAGDQALIAAKSGPTQKIWIILFIM